MYTANEAIYWAKEPHWDESFHFKKFGFIGNEPADNCTFQ